VNTMSSAISKDEALNCLDTFHKFIINNDIPAAINENANYLAALGLSAYTEIIGGLYYGNLKEEPGKHYISFIEISYIGILFSCNTLAIVKSKATD
jgi:hypothetical protein